MQLYSCLHINTHNKISCHWRPSISNAWKSAVAHSKKEVKIIKTVPQDYKVDCCTSYSNKKGKLWQESPLQSEHHIWGFSWVISTWKSTDIRGNPNIFSGQCSPVMLFTLFKIPSWVESNAKQDKKNMRAPFLPAWDDSLAPNRRLSSCMDHMSNSNSNA